MGNGLYGGGVMPANQGAQPMQPAPGAAPGPGANLTPEQQAMMMQMMSGKFQIPPEMIKQAAQTSQQGLEVGQLDRQMKLADQLRADSGDQLKGVQAGRRYVAPGAANMVASLLGAYYGGGMTNDINARRKAMVGEGQTNVEGIMKALGG